MSRSQVQKTRSINDFNLNCIITFVPESTYFTLIQPHDIVWFQLFIALGMIMCYEGYFSCPLTHWGYACIQPYGSVIFHKFFLLQTIWTKAFHFVSCFCSSFESGKLLVFRTWHFEHFSNWTSKKTVLIMFYLVYFDALNGYKFVSKTCQNSTLNQTTCVYLESIFIRFKKATFSSSMISSFMNSEESFDIKDI